MMSASVRYYCTAGSGMEPLLVAEVKSKLAAEDVCQMPGKVLFSSSASIDRVCDLKAAERLFLLLKQDSPVQLSTHIHPAKAASVLQARLLGDRRRWSSAVMTWSRLQGELVNRRTAGIRPRADLGVMRTKEEGRGSEERREEEEKCIVEPEKSTTEQREEESENRRLTTNEDNGAQVLEKKRKREKEERGGGTSPEAKTMEKKRKRDVEGGQEDPRSEKYVEKDQTFMKERSEEEEKGMVVEFTGVISGASVSGGSVCDHAAPGLDHTVESSSRRMDDIVVENVSFRISCKCTGSLTRYFSAQDVNRVLGVGLSTLLGWKADLRNPQLEVNVYLSDDYCLLGISLSRIPLAKRSYIKTTGLRATIAWAMASLAQIQPGFCVVDPMCGVGTILIEAAQEHKAACFQGMDIDDEQLQKANRNVEFAKLGNRIHLLKASSMGLPLPSASVDAVVCDLPFGRKFGTKTNMAANLPFIVTEMERILCVGGTLVLLLSPQLSCLLKKILAQTEAASTSNQETKPETGLKDRPSPSLFSAKQQTVQIHQGARSSSAQATGPESELQRRVARPVYSLKHQETLRVSLGAIDGLIHKYVKTANLC